MELIIKYWYYFVIGIVILNIMISYNNLINKRHNIKRSKGTIDIFLRKRFDLIPNLVEIVKGYSNYEKETLTRLVELRNDFKKNNELDIRNSAEMNNNLTKLIAIVENYPELKASEQYLKLQKELSKVESELSAARRIYNNDVTSYNTNIERFPTNILAKIFRFKSASLFSINENEEEIQVNME